jgi:hypothetical protein
MCFSPIITNPARKSSGGIKLSAIEVAIPQPDEFGRRGQQLWVMRFCTHPSAPHRRAAVKQLGELAPLSADALCALLESVIRDECPNVREMARTVLIRALENLEQSKEASPA